MGDREAEVVIRHGEATVQLEAGLQDREARITDMAGAATTMDVLITTADEAEAV